MKVPTFTPDKPAAAKSQPLPAPARTPEPGPRRSEEAEYVPRYVALPHRRERGHGRRNLIGGVILLVLTVLFLAWALWLAGPGAIFTVAACLATATLLHVMARARLFRQRNGAFVAWAGVCLLGVVLVILHHGWVRVTGGRSASSADKPAAEVSKVPLLSESFVKPDLSAGGLVRVTRDTQVEVEGKQYLAKKGEQYPLVDVGVDAQGRGQYRFSLAGHDVLIPKTAAEVAAGESVPGLETEPPVPGLPPRSGAEVAKQSPPVAPATPAPKTAPAKDQTFEEWFKEQYIASSQAAMKRYPALSRIGSPENRLFRSTSRELELSGERDYFKDPNWPLMLADECAEKEGWKRADGSVPPPRPEAAPEPTDPAETTVPAEPSIPRGEPVRRPLLPR